MGDNKNLLLAIVISLAIILGFQAASNYFFPKPQRPASAPAEQAQTPQPAPAVPGQTVVPPGGGVAGTPTPATPMPGVVPAAAQRGDLLGKSPRLRIDTPRVHGSIALKGGRLDDVTLPSYRETLDPNSPEIVLFSPPGAADPYFVETGWVAVGTGVAVPGPETLWSADRDVLTPENPVTLSWDNGAGVVFTRKIAIDDHYMFTVTQGVENRGDSGITLAPYSLVSRFGDPPTSGFFILFEGPLGVINGTLKEVSYKDLQKEGLIQHTTTGGWIGITDKYWLSALIPLQDERVDMRFIHQRPQNINQYQVDFVGGQKVVAPGETAESISRVFAGAKVVTLIDKYAERYGIDRFDLAIDWGWFYFLTRPMFYALNFLYQHIGNFGLAILAVTVLIKLAFFPLANKSYKSMAQMRKLQPEVAQLRERFADDRTRMNQEMMALYKRQKVNPAAGCLPIIIQIPVFFSLYKVLFVTIEMRHAPFFGWIRDLSAPDPTSVFNLFGLIPWTPPQFMMIGLWPLIMGVTMFLQQKLNPQPPDPVQARIFMILPVVFTFMLAHFPAGLVIYWTWNNILSIIQQWVIMRRQGVHI
ncbi:MAG: membrane protein insertase YidC [Rhodospirillales bacterium]